MSIVLVELYSWVTGESGSMKHVVKRNFLSGTYRNMIFMFFFFFFFFYWLILYCMYSK